jgi:hypothetical protein
MAKRNILIKLYGGTHAHLFTSRKPDGFIGSISYDKHEGKEFKDYTEHHFWLKGEYVGHIDAEGTQYGSHFPPEKR